MVPHYSLSLLFVVSFAGECGVVDIDIDIDIAASSWSYLGVHSMVENEYGIHIPFHIVSIFPVEMEWNIPDQYVGRKVRTFVSYV